jgi:hypothetical protein
LSLCDFVKLWPILFAVFSVMRATNFDLLSILLLACLLVFTIATLLALVNQVSGTPYIVGGDSPAGTDCSGLVSWVTNAATDRPVFGSRFNTGNEEAALLQRGFQYGTAPNALVVGWNGHHTAATLPDGTPVSSGEGGGVHVGGGGAYQPQFTHHMFLPMPDEGPGPPPLPDAPPAPDAAPPPPPAVLVDAAAPAPDLPPPPAAPPVGGPDIATT